MNKMRILGALVLFCTLLGCGTVSVPTLNVGPMQEERISVPLEDAAQADVQLFVGTGELEIARGAEGVLDGVFHYNVAEWKPTVERNRSGSLVSVVLRQGTKKESWGIAGQGARNEWDLRLNDRVPLRLAIAMGAGTSDIDLSGLRLSRLNIDTGAGDTTVTFDAPNLEPLSEIQINCGAGRLDMRSLGNANFERLNIKGGAGDVSLDLNGAWTRSANVEVVAGVGKLSIRVPRQVGVRVRTGISPIGKVIVEGLTSTADGYVNDAYATAAIKVEISLTTGIGEVNITTR